MHHQITRVQARALNVEVDFAELGVPRRRKNSMCFAEVETCDEALCADPDVDVIWIETPNQFHSEHTIMASEAGKHVICAPSL